jgi:hypothetical protein
MLTYRRVALTKVPKKLHALLPTSSLKSGSVVIMDNALDAHLRDVPGWFADRHPNLAGYHVIGDEAAKFLAPLIRARQRVKPEVQPHARQRLVASYHISKNSYHRGLLDDTNDTNRDFRSG